MSCRCCPECDCLCEGCNDELCGQRPCPSCRRELEARKAQDVKFERIRDRVQKLLRMSMLTKHMLNVDYDALNEYYGFHGGPCPATSSSVIPTSPRTT